jgi:hypothetical protein
MNPENQGPQTVTVVINTQDINLLFKYLARVDLKGAETPEFNKILSIFDSRNFAKPQEKPEETEKKS